MTTSSSEWNAQAYHRVSDPQFRWGLKVLERLPLKGDEHVLDAGCGSGRLTAVMLERLPRGRVLAVDNSENMLAQARATLAEKYEGRVSFLKADLANLHVPEKVDVIFSTATFHWVLDHDRLFRSLAAALKPGGRLHAQCGGGPNLHRVYGRAERIWSEPRYAKLMEGFHHPTYFATPEETRPRLIAAGFEAPEVNLEEALTVFPDADAYRAFLEAVILRVPLMRLNDGELRSAFLERMVQAGSSDQPPFSLDYWRLNVSARLPEAP